MGPAGQVHTIPTASVGTTSSPWACLFCEAAPDVTLRGIRRNRNAAMENAPTARSPHSNPAGRRKFLPAGGAADDPRTPSPQGSPRISAAPVPPSLAGALASDATAPVGRLVLARSSDTAVGLSTTSSDAPIPGTRRCSNKPQRTQTGNNCRIPSTGRFANCGDRRELVCSKLLKHAEGGPRELVSRKVKSRIEATTSIRGDSYLADVSTIAGQPALQLTRPPHPQPLRSPLASPPATRDHQPPAISLSQRGQSG